MLEIGKAYYRLTYADPDQTIPGLTPMIYISDDLFPTDTPDIQTYFFQDTVSYRLIGSAADPESSRSESDVQIQIFTAKAAQLGNSVLELREAICRTTRRSCPPEYYSQNMKPPSNITMESDA